MQTIYDVIEILPFDGHSWFGDAHKYKLSEFLSQKNIKTIIEVGSWLGGSTRFMAKLLPEDGYLIAVDHWKGDDSITSTDPSFNLKLPQLFQQFLSNSIHEGLANRIVPMRMSSEEASKAIKIKPDLLYLDAAHDEESVYKDLTTWWPNMHAHSIMCGDDYNPQVWPGVVNAVNGFAKEHGFVVQDLGGFWWYENSK